MTNSSFVEISTLLKTHPSTIPPPSSSPSPLEEPGWCKFMDVTPPLHLKACFRLFHHESQAFPHYSHTHKSSSRINRFYITPSSRASLHFFHHIHVWTDLSDHPYGNKLTLSCPFHPELKRGTGPWCLNTSHLRQPALTRNIKDICSFYSNTLNRPLNWWDKLKLDIRKACQDHGRAESARVKGQIRALHSKVATLSTKLLEHPSHPQTCLDLMQAEQQLSSYLNTKLSFIRQCAAMKSNPHSVNTLKILSNKIKTRKAKTFIHSLTHHGSTAYTPEEIHNHASSFFRNLYKHTSDGRPDHPIWNTHRSLPPPDVSTDLSSPITMKDLESALTSLPDNKIPGADGLPKKFSKAYWHLIGPLFLPPSMSQAITVLIFKKANPQDLANYRPIFLLVTDYKIIAKLLLQRLITASPHLIHDDQSGFEKGCSIHDTLFNVLDTLDICNSSQKAWLPLPP